MNAFYEHHKNSIGLHYRCFDRLLLNGLIQPFQQPKRVIGFFNTYRAGKRVTRNELVTSPSNTRMGDQPVQQVGRAGDGSARRAAR